jgi:hypothetical protein
MCPQETQRAATVQVVYPNNTPTNADAYRVDVEHAQPESVAVDRPRRLKPQRSRQRSRATLGEGVR